MPLAFKQGDFLEILTTLKMVRIRFQMKQTVYFMEHLFIFSCKKSLLQLLGCTKTLAREQQKLYEAVTFSTPFTVASFTTFISHRQFLDTLLKIRNALGEAQNLLHSGVSRQGNLMHFCQII